MGGRAGADISFPLAGGWIEGGGGSIVFLLLSSEMMLIKLLNLSRDCESVDAPRVNNIGYVLSGYDIYHGNPIPTSGIVDPGFRSLIFQG